MSAVCLSCFKRLGEKSPPDLKTHLSPPTSPSSPFLQTRISIYLATNTSSHSYPCHHDQFQALPLNITTQPQPHFHFHFHTHSPTSATHLTRNPSKLTHLPATTRTPTLSPNHYPQDPSTPNHGSCCTFRIILSRT